MEVRFKSRRLERAFNREKAAVCEWGKENADRALRRYLDLRKVTKIRIIAVEDYHGR